MIYSNVLVTGGAGFIGSNLCMLLRERQPSVRITALDSLKRRGSELNIPRLLDHDVRFVHGDIRCTEDLEMGKERFDLIIECSAEPSVLAGFGDNPGYVIQTNLVGTVNCLELARRQGSDFLFLSTSRVYPVELLSGLPLVEGETRFELAEEQALPGVSSSGISEQFPLTGYRTLYGATKLASELLVEEYRNAYGVRSVVNRCGVVAGPWQMGKADQGVFALWLLAHHFRKPLKYIGYGGSGKQLRDLVHVNDLFEALYWQLEHMDVVDGRTFNLGGGRASCLSLKEATSLCEEITGNCIPMGVEEQPRDGDVPLYVTDHGSFSELSGWRPKATPKTILADMQEWVLNNESSLARILRSS